MPGCSTLRKCIASIALTVPAPQKQDEGAVFPLFLHYRPASLLEKAAPSLKLPVEGFSVRVFSSIHQASFHWNALRPPENCFLEEPYLRALEQSPPEGVVPYYLVFFREDRPVGLAYLQLIDFQADQSLQSYAPEGFWDRLLFPFRKKALKLLRFRILQVGNLLLTGPRGYYFPPEAVGEEDVNTLLAAALPIVRKYLRRRFGYSIPVYVVKDMPMEDNAGLAMPGKGYWKFCFLPNMILRLSPEWETFGDYLAGLQSKYRIRVRRALRLLDGVESRELDARDIAEHKKNLYRLYRNVADSVDFNMVSLHPDYFSSLKNELGDSFHLVGYFLNGRLNGFYTTIENGAELEAHFIGFDPDINRDHQLYLNMLFDMIRMGIDLRSSHISFARTATEIKSSVGAVAEQYRCYIRHRSVLANIFTGPLVYWLQPEESWGERHPFRK